MAYEPYAIEATAWSETAQNHERDHPPSSLMESTSHDPPTRPHDAFPHTGIQDAKDHLESLDELRKGATDDLAKLARKQNEDPQVILNPEKKGEVEEIDPVQKGEDRRAASNARKEALLEAKRKQEEERARLATKAPPPPRRRG